MFFVGKHTHLVLACVTGNYTGMYRQMQVSRCRYRKNQTNTDKHRLISSPVRYVLKIHFFIESGLKMIQFKTKSKIFIQKNIHSKQNPKYSFKKIFIQ